ncbi:restriction endonuclease subunit S [Microbacterium sp. BG28]|uniref:restriction endonuclease subunit S n=1 Tax=Microbacterium sp. BG28 TaxID=3097356 RepID=UPI002A5A162B|nr:restriction endonuclease subunit S [Microbacterium sp. BG28]MDY0828541.1 restriction endonuclease subunit S [Microbacterium sp. BG28]
MSSAERRLCRLGDVTVSQNSRRRPVKSTERSSGPYPYYGASGIVDYVDSYLFEGLHLLIAEDGENLRSRTTPVAFLADGQFWVNNHAHVLQGNSFSDTRYLAYAVGQLDLSRYLTGSTQPKLTKGALESVMLDLPPLAEQQAIAEVLGALDDKIAANTALAANAERLLRAEVDVAWLRREDRSSTLAEFVDFNPKVSVPRSESAVYVDMKRLPESGWSIDGYDHREPRGGARFRNGDTLLARITPCLENRKTGFVDHLEDDEVGIGSTEFIVMRARHGIAAPVSFLLATEARFREFAIQHMIGTSGRQRVAASDLAAFELPTPDFAWLDQFGERVDALFAAVAAQARENRTLAATRDAMLPQLMSGKLRVRDAEKAAAEAGA